MRWSGGRREPGMAGVITLMTTPLLTATKILGLEEQSETAGMLASSQ